MTQPTEASHPRGDFGFGGAARQTVKMRRIFAGSRPASLKPFSADFERAKNKVKKGVSRGLVARSGTVWPPQGVGARPARKRPSLFRSWASSTRHEHGVSRSLFSVTASDREE